jgi:DegV family protein with EDD domain
MSFQIIADSCSDLTKEQRKSGDYKLVPLTLEIGAETFIDDESFQQSVFIEKMKAYPDAPKSACPAPEAYLELFDQAEDTYVVTLSSKLSGSYNSAEVAKQMYLEQGEKNIAIIDSQSASVGETLLAMKIKELAATGLSFDEVVKKVCEFRSEMTTLFVLEDLDNLRKNGRLSNVKALLASVLNIKPVMISTPEGMIEQADQARGMKKALIKMAELAAQKVIRPEEKILGIAHCNNYERGAFVRDEILKRAPFKDCILVDTAGVSTLYANDGGVIVSF